MAIVQQDINDSNNNNNNNAPTPTATHAVNQEQICPPSQ
jgi:hypothetical protein